MKFIHRWPGEPCKNCSVPLVERRHNGIPKRKPGSTYYFKRWLLCPGCKRLYMIEDEKIFWEAEQESSNLLSGLSPLP